MKRLLICVCRVLLASVPLLGLSDSFTYKTSNVAFPIALNDGGDLLGYTYNTYIYGGAPAGLQLERANGAVLNLGSIPQPCDITICTTTVAGFNNNDQVYIYQNLLDDGNRLPAYQVSGRKWTEVEVNNPPGFESMNNSGQIAGNNQFGAFLFQNGKYNYISGPGGTPPPGPMPQEACTPVCANAINDSEQVAGSNLTGAFLYQNGRSTTFNDPLGPSSASAIGKSGQILGTYFRSSQSGDFLYANGKFTSIDYPGSTPNGTPVLNGSGQVLGSFFNSAGKYSPYLFSNGTFSLLDYPGSIPGTTTPASFETSYPEGFNDRGEVIGTYQDAAGQHSFLYDNGNYSQINFPGASQTTVEGINNEGELFGWFDDASGNYGTFTADPTAAAAPEPATFGLLGIAALCFFFVNSRTSNRTESAGAPAQPSRNQS